MFVGFVGLEAQWGWFVSALQCPWPRLKMEAEIIEEIINLYI